MSRIDQAGTTTSKRRRPAMLWIGLALVGMASTAMAVVGTRHGGRCHGGHWGHHWDSHGGAHNVESLEDAREHGVRAAQRLLDEVDADDEQRRKVIDIVEDAVEEVHGLAGDHHAHREAFLKAFEGEHVDRAEIERIRSAEIELADAASRQLTNAIADVSEVLSPAQRETLLERIAEHHR